jgi:cyanophycinase
MGKSDSTLIAIGGGEIAESKEVLDELTGVVKRSSNPRMVVMTAATNDPAMAARKYVDLFKHEGIKHVDAVDISKREDSFNADSLKLIEKADGLFFTGGDQLNVTSLLGGSPLHDIIHKRYHEGFLIAGTSAGAMMMSSSMIISGRSDDSPKVGGVEFAPGLNLIEDTIIDTHFSQRGRHGRLLTAIAHYPQAMGIGLDEKTAMVLRGNEFRVLGEGVVTVADGSKMKHTDLAYRRDDQTVGMFDVCLHVLPSGYKFDMKNREPIAPALKKIVVGGNDI